MKFKRNILLLFVIIIVVAVGMLFAMRYQTQGDKGSRENSTVPRVQVEQPMRKSISTKLDLNGDILPWQQATLYSKVAGYLKEIRVDKGDWVKHGEILAIIDDRETQKEYERAVADYHLQEITYNRLNDALPQTPNLVSKQDVDAARAKYESAKANMERLKVFVDYATIRAPFSGVVTQRWVDPGAMIQAANTSTNVMAIVRIASMNKVRVRVDVPESEVPLVKVGTLAHITVRELSGQTFEGKVTRFGVALDMNTRTMQTEIDLSNPRHILRPGMFAKVTMDLETGSDVLTIPAAALITEKNQTFVYCVEQGIVKKRDVIIGTDDGIRPVVNQGLTKDDQVIVTGKAAVRESMRVIPVKTKQ